MTISDAELFPSYIPDLNKPSRVNILAGLVGPLLPDGIRTSLRHKLYPVYRQHHIGDEISIDFQGGQFKFIIQSDSCIVRFFEDSVEREFGEDLLFTIKAADRPIFADIGSAQGKYSIPAALLGAKIVYAFEPDPVSCDYFDNNLQLNTLPSDCEGIVHFQQALGDVRDMISLHYDRSGTYAPSLRKVLPGLVDNVVVEMVTFDELVEQESVEPPTIVKIDVEGAEGLVLKGMEKLLRSNRRPSDIFIEIHTEFLKEFGWRIEKVVGFLRGLGYKEKTVDGMESKVWQRGNDFLCLFVYSS